MLQTKVESSTIDTIGWKDGKLFVRFLKGTCYRYDDVPHEVYVEMINAPSVGKFLHARIIPSYPAARIDLESIVWDHGVSPVM